MGPGYGRGRGLGLGRGPGLGMGLGRGRGWFSVGYGAMDTELLGSVRSSLEERKEILRAELARTAALLAGADSSEADQGKGNDKK